MKLKTLLLLLLSQTAFASPWMTGPLLAPSGKTIAKGHYNVEPYAFYTEYPGGFKNFEIVPIFSMGLTDSIDFQTSIPFDHNWVKNASGSGLGDYTVGMGFQIFKENEKTWQPNLRFVIQEVLPAGDFENFDPLDLGTTQTGGGAYKTVLGLNFQKLFTLENERYLRTRLNFVGAYSTEVDITGSSTFGGVTETSGTIKPGLSYSIDLAFEYTLTQNWVPALDILFSGSTSTSFEGNPGFTPDGTLVGVGGKGGNSLSLAPAIEYNFSANLGVIAGVWFSVATPKGADFVTGAIAVDLYI
jgi:hypothetical protein